MNGVHVAESILCRVCGRPGAEAGCFHVDAFPAPVGAAYIRRAPEPAPAPETPQEGRTR